MRLASVVSAARAVVLAIVAALLLGACSIPVHTGVRKATKVAVDGADARAVVRRYEEVYATAASLLDAKPLSIVETGAVLAIDSGSFTVSAQSAQRPGDHTFDLLDVDAPRLTHYPLWFVARIKDVDRKVVKVAVFERGSAIDPWLMVSSPETLVGTSLPSFARGSGGTLIPVAADAAAGLVMSPERAAQTYANAVADPKSADAKKVVHDAFITQMREAAAANAALDGVTFSQDWAVEDVNFAARTGDGGALVWVTLLRQDNYTVTNGLSVSWPDGSPQQALLGDAITSSGSLKYYHQLLLFVPAAGAGQPRALGQFGGVIGAG